LYGRGPVRAVVNIGGIANLTDLPAEGAIRGFDCGPGNMLMDAWIHLHLGKSFDIDGKWASSGRVISGLLESLLADGYFSMPPPKSTGRDRFGIEWLENHLDGSEDPSDVQATLLLLTAKSISDSIGRHCASASEIYLCGGGSRNAALVKELRSLLRGRSILTTESLGIEVDHVEAAAFAWLARQAIKGLPGNLPEVTGSRGKRILGAIHPA
ncbi:MAG TPA: anhydro-N-acetylmuramic acid kinase, partial [Burkholderiales bacterium]|nr:anhydro-N-acetylmuramic acid kinase [Burkholderiales bacterium]